MLKDVKGCKETNTRPLHTKYLKLFQNIQLSEKFKITAFADSSKPLDCKTI